VGGKKTSLGGGGAIFGLPSSALMPHQFLDSTPSSKAPTQRICDLMIDYKVSKTQ
jgi:hypothetical protein